MIGKRIAQLALILAISVPLENEAPRDHWASLRSRYSLAISGMNLNAMEIIIEKSSIGTPSLRKGFKKKITAETISSEVVEKQNIKLIQTRRIILIATIQPFNEPSGDMKRSPVICNMLEEGDPVRTNAFESIEMVAMI